MTFRNPVWPVVQAVFTVPAVAGAVAAHLLCADAFRVLRHGGAALRSAAPFNSSGWQEQQIEKFQTDVNAFAKDPEAS